MLLGQECAAIARSRASGESRRLLPFRMCRRMWYRPGMTKLLDQAVETVRNLPNAAQDAIAYVVLRLAADEDEEGPIVLSQQERAAVARSKAAAARGEFATDEQVRAAWAKHGL